MTTTNHLPAKVSREVNDIMEQVIAKGDLGQLTADERNAYYMRVCESLGLNPLTRPLEYVKLQGKLVLYARKDCTEQLRKRDGVSIVKLDREAVGDLYVVTAYASNKEGRQDSDMGAVSIVGLKGEMLVNAMLKAVTKAKRRVTLSICGLGFLDETEVESIPGATAHREALPAPESATITPQQGKVLAGAMKAQGVLAASLFKAFGIRRLGELPASRHDEALLWIGEHGQPAADTNDDGEVIGPDEIRSLGEAMDTLLLKVPARKELLARVGAERLALLTPEQARKLYALLEEMDVSQEQPAEAPV